MGLAVSNCMDGVGLVVSFISLDVRGCFSVARLLFLDQT